MKGATGISMRQKLGHMRKAIKAKRKKIRSKRKAKQLASISDEDIEQRVNLLRSIEQQFRAGEITEGERVQKLRQAFPMHAGDRRGRDVVDFERERRFDVRKNKR